MNFIEYKNIVHSPKKKKMKGDRIYNFERNISARISWFLFRFLKFIKPNHVTFFSFLILLIVFILNFLKELNNSMVITLVQLLLLYFITITDRVDGELARANDFSTQKGMYYDRTVHFFYPFIFYFSIAYHFLVLSGNLLVFSLSIFLGVLTINLVMFGEAKLSILEKLKKDNFNIRDFIPEDADTRYKRKNIVFRFLDYLSFMIYAWVLFFYIAVIILSSYNYELAWYLYLFQIILALVINLYRVFYSLPKNKLYRESIKDNL